MAASKDPVQAGQPPAFIPQVSIQKQSADQSRLASPNTCADHRHWCSKIGMFPNVPPPSALQWKTEVGQALFRIECLARVCGFLKGSNCWSGRKARQDFDISAKYLAMKSITNSRVVAAAFP